MKNCQIPPVIFQTTSYFSKKILHHSLVSWKITPLYFLSLNIIYFGKKIFVKVQKFWGIWLCFTDLLYLKVFHDMVSRVPWSKLVEFVISFLKWQVISSSNFSSFFIAITHNSPVNFNFIYFLFWVKGSHQILNFDTFKCSSANLSNSWCHFPNHKISFCSTFASLFSIL